MREGSHVIVLPFPAQGHITPMSQFCKRLVSKGLKITLILVSDKPSPPYRTEHDLITVVPISNGFQEDEEQSQDLDDYMERVETSIKTRLPKLIEDMKLSGNPPRALVYDSTMPWLLDVAHSSGLRGAVFFTQPWLVSTIYYHVNKGSFSVPSTRHDHSALASFPSFPMLNSYDLPSFLRESSSYPNILRIVIDQLSNIDRVDIVLCNTFDKLEEKLLKWVQSLWPVLNIGPTVPSMYLDKRLTEDKNYGFSLFDANVAKCIEWLDSKQPSSVVYVSLGSLVILKEDQMMELAAGLKQSGYFFLWVVRDTEKNKLPRNWSPQLEVLRHESIGCFLTHCGWNSMLEGLSLGVPMIGMPHWADQPTNGKFMEDVWKVGVRVKADVDGFVRSEEIVKRVGEVMEGEKGKEIRKNAEKWKLLTLEAVSEGGRSDKSINEFVSMFC
ncbi:hypothetical protein CARUB_v10011842mg [Capsella rubella]|uniref:Glycosyltransferase n=1 Tax=Capsella rubella TaxID=81985 RepID=R0IKN0_9BRAS|nr:hypothetical protein CARUB_v10011842mg [Capsella rubella]